VELFGQRSLEISARIGARAQDYDDDSDQDGSNSGSAVLKCESQVIFE